MGGGCRIQAALFCVWTIWQVPSKSGTISETFMWYFAGTVRRVFQTKSIDSFTLCRMGKAVIIEHSVNTGHTG